MGLLDNAFGNGWDDPQSQMMMGLAQGLLSARGGAGLAAGLGNMQAVQQNGVKNKLINAQLANYQSEIDARKLAGVKDARQQALIESMFGGGASATDSPMTSGAASPSSGGAGGVGGFASGGNGSAQTLIQTARKYGIPDQAIQSDMVFNGGKGIAAMIEKHGARDMQVSNGYAYDKNNMGAGYLPSLTTSQDGKTSMVQIGPDGQPVVSAPRGAMETFGGYQDAQAARKPIKVFNPATQREEYTNEAAVVGGQQPQGGPAPAGGMPGRTGNPMIDAVMQTESGGNPNAVSPAGARGLMQVMPGTNTAPGFGVAPARDNSEAERTRVGRDYHGAMMERYKDPALAAIAYNWGPGNTDMWLKSGGDYNKLPAETKSYVSQVLTRNGVNGQGGQAPQPAQPGNYAAGPSAQEAAMNEANKTRLVNTAGADVVRDTSKQQAGKLGSQMLTAADRALELLGQGPTASGAGALRDSAANFVGMSTKGADVASQLDTLSGWLTSNVPRMEGPQSDKDVLNYRIMAGAVGDRTKPISQRLAAAQELKTLQTKYADLNGVTLNTGGATGSWGDKPAAAPATKAPTPMKGMVRGGYKFKGGDPSDQANWERQ